MKLLQLLVPIALLTSAAAAQDVRYNFDKSANFERYRTFKWVQIKDAQKLNPLVDQQVRTAVAAELAKKGLAPAPGEDADIWIAYQFTLTQEKQFSSYSTDFGYGPGWGGGWYGYGGMGSSTTTGQTSTIHIGELALDMYDPATKQIVWRGAASKTLDTKAKPEKRQKNLEKGVAKLLKNFPPQVKKS